MAILPFDQVREFVDKSLVEELAPRGAVFYGWRSVGAVVRPFRWRPVFRRPGYLADSKPRRPELSFQEARGFLELLAVAQAAPVLSIAALGHCIDRSAGRLLGLEDFCGSEHGRRSAESFDGFEECPDLAPDALIQARTVFKNRRNNRYAQRTPVISRLAEALARDGGFADEGRIVEVAIALEKMYDLPQRGISRTLQNRVSGYLGTDAASRERIKESVKEFYEARSKIVHSREVNVSPPGNRESFGRGLDSCLRALRKGDVLVVWKLDRLGRNLAHLVNTVQDLSARGVGLRVLAGQGAQVDTTTAAGRLVFGIFAALAEFERELIRERTLAGLKAARARGRKGGRKFALSKAQVRLAQAAMAHRDTSVSELCTELGIKPVTLYRYVGPQGQLREQGQKVLAS